jgi:hypothetical protein
MRASLAIVLFAAACGGHAAPAAEPAAENTPPPEEPPQPEPALKTFDGCSDAASTVARLLVIEGDGADPTITESERNGETDSLRVAMSHECRDRGWSADVIACFAHMQAPAEIEGCYQQMTDAQADSFNTTVDNN